MKMEKLLKEKTKNSWNLKVLPLFYCSLLLFAFSCKKQDPPQTFGKHSEYYPLKIGNSYTYQVDSIFFNDFDQSIDTTYFQVTELYADTFYDVEGHLNYRLERYCQYKSNPQQSYDTLSSYLKDVWFVTYNNNSIERVEENMRFITLVNPISESKSWDGNASNFLDRWRYKYVNFGKPYDIYDDAVTVERQLDSNVIEYRKAYQIFAKNIGMVEYYHIDVEDRRAESSALIPIVDRINKGTIVHYKLVKYNISE